MYRCNLFCKGIPREAKIDLIVRFIVTLLFIGLGTASSYVLVQNPQMSVSPNYSIYSTMLAYILIGYSLALYGILVMGYDLFLWNINEHNKEPWFWDLCWGIIFVIPLIVLQIVILANDIVELYNYYPDVFIVAAIWNSIVSLIELVGIIILCIWTCIVTFDRCKRFINKRIEQGTKVVENEKLGIDV